MKGEEIFKPDENGNMNRKESHGMKKKSKLLMMVSYFWG